MTEPAAAEPTAPEPAAPEPSPRGPKDPNRATRCPIQTRTTGEQCKNDKIRGAPTCKKHGSGAKHVRAAAARRVAAAAAEAAVAAYGLRRDIDPNTALLEEVQWSAGHVAWLRARVQEIDPKALTVGVAEQRIDPAGGKSVLIRTEPNIWLELYDRERRHLLAVCTAALRAGIEDRAVRLAERQGELVAQVVRAILGDLDLTAEQWATAREAVPRHLRAVTDD